MAVALLPARSATVTEPVRRSLAGSQPPVREARSAGHVALIPDGAASSSPATRSGGRSSDPPVRVRVRRGVVRRDIRVAVRRLARRLLPARPAPAGLARALRPRLPHRRGEQRLLPAARALGLRAVAAADARGLRRGREGEPVPHARPPPPDPPSRSGRLVDRAAGLGDRLGPYLLQLPPTLRADAERLDACLAAFPTDARVAVEPRHESWWTDEVRAVLERRGAALCWADRRGRPVAPLWRTARWGYVRLHEGTASPPPTYGRTAPRVVARPHRRRVAGGPSRRTCSSTSTTTTARPPSATPARCRAWRATLRRAWSDDHAVAPAVATSAAASCRASVQSSTPSMCFSRPDRSWSRGWG